MERMIEICCGSFEDALAAMRGGAKRIELNSALFLGGLTPSLGSLILTKKHTDLKVIAMVRPRAAGFCYGPEEFETMKADAQLLMEHGADGIAFGCLDENGNVQEEQTRQMIEIIRKYGGEVVFHRAFDCVPDPYEAIEKLISLGTDRILTSGFKAKAMEGMDLIKELQQAYGDRIELLAGCGMNAENAKEMMDVTGISQVHSSCKGWKTDSTTTGKEVNYCYAAAPHENDYDVVEEDLVRKIVEAV
jgi:copper homeostasis protein